MMNNQNSNSLVAAKVQSSINTEIRTDQGYSYSEDSGSDSDSNSNSGSESETEAEDNLTDKL